MALRNLSSFGIKAGRAAPPVETAFEAEYAAGADHILARTGRKAFDAVRILAPGPT